MASDSTGKIKLLVIQGPGLEIHRPPAQVETGLPRSQASPAMPRPRGITRVTSCTFCGMLTAAARWSASPSITCTVPLLPP
jgi:hypothetical protein